MPNQIHNYLISKNTFRMHNQEGKNVKFFYGKMNLNITYINFSLFCAKI